MQKIKVADDIEFAYQDSGVPSGKEAGYDTIIIIHGHTYHSGVFQRMIPVAKAKGYRMILPNRRLYPGSTPYTEAEAKALDSSNSTDDIVKSFSKQGEYLLLFVDGVIQELGLTSVTACGWSLGTCFMNTLVGAIESVSAETKQRLATTVKNLVWWDPPATGHGIEAPPSGDWIPLYDETIAPEQRGMAFAQWLSQYYPHPDLDQKDCHKLIYKLDAPGKTPTFTGMPFEELVQLVDFSAGPTADNQVADRHFQPVHRILCRNAFFNSKIREAWGDAVKFTIICGEEGPYNILWATWKLQEESERTGLPISFKAMPGVNHFGMHDHPEISLSTILERAT